MANFIEFLDEVDTLVQEYLMFRGFTNTFAAYQQDLRQDHASKFNVQKIVHKVLRCVRTHDYRALMDLWNFLNFRFFSHLDGDFAPMVKRVEVSLKRFFIVTAVGKGGAAQRDTVMAFLREECQGKSDEEDLQWRPWFALPFLASPQNDPQFGTYFRAKWEDFFVSSFRNFLTAIFQNIPLPKLLSFKLGRQEIDGLRRRLRASHAEQSRLECKLAQVELQLDMARQRNKMLSLYRVDKLPQDQGAPPPSSRRSPASTLSPLASASAGATSVRAPATAGDMPAAARASATVQPRRRSTPPPVVEHAREEPLVLDDDTDEEPMTHGDGGSSNGAGDGDKEPLPLGDDEPPLPLTVRRNSNASTDSATPRSPGGSRSGGGGGDGGNSGNAAAAPAEGQGSASLPAAGGTRGPAAEPALCPFDVVNTVEIHGHSGAVTKAAFSADGAYFATGSDDATVRVWSLGDDPALRRATRVKTFCCTGGIMSLDWVDERSFLFGTSQNEVRLVNIGNGADRSGAGADGTTSFSTFKTEPDFSRVLDVKSQPRTSKCVTSLGTHSAAEAARLAGFHVATTAGINASGRPAAAGGGGGSAAARLVIWDYKTSTRLHHLELGPVSAPVSSMAFSHNGGILIAGDRDGVVRFFDMHAYSTFQAKNVTDSPVLAVRFCPDFNSILTLSAAGRLQQWSTKMFGTCIQEWAVHGAAGSGYCHLPVADMAFSHDDSHIVTSSPDGTVPLYNLRDSSAAAPSHLPELDTARVVSAAWHPRIPRLLTGSADKTIRVWNLAASKRAGGGDGV